MKDNLQKNRDVYVKTENDDLFVGWETKANSGFGDLCALDESMEKVRDLSSDELIRMDRLEGMFWFTLHKDGGAKLMFKHVPGHKQNNNWSAQVNKGGKGGSLV